MKTLGLFLSLIFITQFCSFAFAQSPEFHFMTSRDMMQSDTSANIMLRNTGNSAATVYGLYVHSFSYVTPGQTCGSAVPIFPSVDIPADNITAGSYVSPVTINAGKSISVGKNYLYNMIYQANYYVYMNMFSSPLGCAIPGCTWGSDTTIYNWCVKLGALSPVSTSPGYTASVPPSAMFASDSGYDYNMIDSYVTLGPISCNDQTLTCMVENQQTQPIP